MNSCQSCGHINSENADVCASCGAKLDETVNVVYLKPGTKLSNGRFTAGRKLGQGGFGITYMGSDVEDKSPVAIKEFFLAGCSRQSTTVTPAGNISGQNFENIRGKFLEEGKVLSRFHHPGIVKIESVFEENNTAYIVMEYLKGSTLKQVIKRDGKLSENQAVEYILNILDALNEVHRAKFLHRDIKPENIIITDDGRVVLIDFGAANEKRAKWR